jgi:hypothetical protein
MQCFKASEAAMLQVHMQAVDERLQPRDIPK